MSNKKPDLACLCSPSNLLILFFVLTLGGANAFGVYQFFYKAPYLSYENLPFPVLSKEVRAGGTVPVLVKRCNNDDVPHTYTLARTLERVNTPHRKRYTLESQQVYIQPGCDETTSTGAPLPPEIPPGEYRLSGHAEINVGLRTYRIEWYSETFKVIAP